MSDPFFTPPPYVHRTTYAEDPNWSFLLIGQQFFERENVLVDEDHIVLTIKQPCIRPEWLNEADPTGIFTQILSRLPVTLLPVLIDGEVLEDITELVEREVTIPLEDCVFFKEEPFNPRKQLGLN